ncbi:MAG TPA: hypothetical protein VF092_23550 [Longimicrobium sp.]
MAISVPFPPSEAGGPMTGELVHTFLDPRLYQVAIWYEKSGAWKFNAYVPVAPLWSFGLVQAGTRYAAAVVDLQYVPVAGRLPVPGPRVADVAVFPPGRVSLNVGTGVVNGTVDGLGAPTAFRVRVYAWSPAAAWSFVGDSPVNGDGAWSVSTTLSPGQWAALLVPGDFVPPSGPGLLPAEGVVNTVFSGGVGVGVVAWPGAAGGPLQGALRGVARGTGLWAYAVSVPAAGPAVFALAPVQPNGAFAFEHVRRGAAYAVVITDSDNDAFYALPTAVGGRVITYATSS